MLTSAELDDIRADAETSLTSTCTIQAKLRAADGAGGSTYGTPTTSGPYDCRVEQSGRNDDSIPVIAGGPKPRRYVYIVLPHDATVKPGDTIVIGSNSYPVVSVPARTLSCLLRVQCWESAS